MTRTIVRFIAAGALVVAGCSASERTEPSVSIVSDGEVTSTDGGSVVVEQDDDPESPSTGNDVAGAPSVLIGASGTLLTTSPSDGNRLYDGVLDLTASPTIAQVGIVDGFAPVANAGDPSGPPNWTPIVIDTERFDALTGAGGTALGGPAAFDDASYASITGRSWFGALTGVSGTEDGGGAIPDSVPVSNGTVTVLLVEPTERYPHGALGDRIEAAAIRVIGPSQTIDIALPESDVVEGTSAMLADLDDDGVDEIIVTQANRSGGARLVAYGLDGELIAESEPIGTTNRWRHQIAVGPTGPDGETELVVVRTPHIGGIVEWFRLERSGGDARLELVSRFDPSTGGIHTTSHPIGTTLLDLAAVFDADGDGALELVIPTQDRSSLAIVGRTNDGAELEALVDIPGNVSTNLAIAQRDDGSLFAAVGTDSGQLVTWPGAP